jgi:hypothetical protein
LSCLKTLPRFGGALCSYRAAVARWPAARITLRQGIRVVHDAEVGDQREESEFLAEAVIVGQKTTMAFSPQL